MIVLNDHRWRLISNSKLYKLRMFYRRHCLHCCRRSLSCGYSNNTHNKYSNIDETMMITDIEVSIENAG